MAEIPIERKENRNWLPLILGLLALSLLAFWFLRPRIRGGVAVPADTTAAEANAPTSPTAASAADSAVAGGAAADALSRAGG